MQRARRLASVAVVAAVAVTGLSACRSQPDVAAYLATGNISVARVQKLYDVARDERATTLAIEAKSPTPAPTDPAAPADPPAGPPPPLNSDVVLDLLVSHQVLMTMAQRRNVQMPSPLPIARYAKLLHLPDASEFLKLDVEVDALQFALRQDSKAGAPTDADLRDLLERLKAQKLADPTTTPEKFATDLTDADKTLLGGAFVLRNEVRDEVSQLHLRLNPRYQAFEIPALTQLSQAGTVQVLVGQPVGNNKASVPVTDVG
jgi:hypothetical protein